MKKEVEKAMNEAHHARELFRVGILSHEEAKRKIQPYLDLVNEGGKRLSKKFKNKFHPVTLTGFLR